MRRLLDSALFWLAFGAAVIVGGGVGVAVGTGLAVSGHESVWAENWFRVGFAIVLLGGLMLLWALVLFLAHRHAAGHWCPDPDAHKLSTVRTRPTKAQPDDTAQLRSVLRQLRTDVLTAKDRVTNMKQTGHYWKGSEGNPPLRTWKKNRKKLAARAGMVDVYESAADAFGRVDRLIANKGFKARPVRSDEDLDTPLQSLENAETKIEDKLRELG